MCGRFTQFFSWTDLAATLGGFVDIPDFDTDRRPLQPRYNLAPTQEAVAIRSDAGAPRLGPMKWGFPNPHQPGEVINARSETAAELPMFRDAAARRRCLIPASGFYEWDRHAPGGKQPWFLRAESELFLLAGLWRDGPGGPLFVVLTCDTPPGFEPTIHHRMPLVVRPEHAAAWLDPGVDAAGAIGLGAPFGAPETFGVRAWAVSTRVNSAGNEGAGLLERVEPAAGLFG
ncbi:MAG: SOS response-associated peptidase [Phycisphaerales bacterium]|nr:SOS response-associated peptidase [Planctomycetota bacterium]MCH8509581.1 SOS response-associated peptidase [Phycisphaerales bacterium]